MADPEGVPVGRRRRRLKWSRVLTAFTSAAVLVGSGTSWCVYRELRGGLVTSDAMAQVTGPAPRRLDNAVNVLLIGLDSRRDMDGRDLPKRFVADVLHAGSSEIGGYNTNTLILLHVPAGGGRVQAFSIPRDDWVQTYSGDGTPQGFHKIKEAYGRAKAVAEARLLAQGVTGAALERESRDAGRAATIATVQHFLGLPVDHFAEVNLLGFYDVARVVQPITVCLRHATRDPAVEGQGSGADFHAGLNTLDASQALAFVRQRHNLAGGDLDRTARQQAFLSSVVHKLRDEGVLGDLSRMRGLLDVVRKDVVLDRGWKVLDFLTRAPDLTRNAVFHTLPVAGFAQRGGESVNLVDLARVRALVRAFTSGAASRGPSRPRIRAVRQEPPSVRSPAPRRGTRPPQPPPGPGPGPAATVDVLNGSGAQGAAAARSAALAAAGWARGRIGNAPHTAVTTVRYGPGAEAAGRRIAAWTGAAARPSAAVPAGHVLIVLGTGGRRPGPAEPLPPHPASAFYGTPVRMHGVPCVD